MSDTPAAMPSLADRVRPIAAGAAVVGVHFLGKTPVFVLGEEALLFAGEDGERRVAIHAGGILASAVGRRAHRHRRRRRHARRHRRQRRASRSSPPTTRSAGSTRSRSARTAPSPGRPARSRMCSPRRARSAPTRRRRPSPGSLSRRKASALAIAHYNGVTLWFPNAAGAKPEMLEWKGSHLERRLQPGRQVSRHRDAGADAARLAPRRRQAHAHVGLFGARALARLDRGRRFPRHLGLRAAHPLAVRRQGRAHGPAAEAAGAVAGARVGGRLPSAPAGGGGGLCRRRGACWCASTTAR